MSPPRKTAFITGALFVITFLTSIPPKIWLYPPLLGHSDYIIGSGGDAPALWGAFLEVLWSPCTRASPEAPTRTRMTHRM
jgi:hypothetical protein